MFPYSFSWEPFHMQQHKNNFPLPCIQSKTISSSQFTWCFHIWVSSVSDLYWLYVGGKLLESVLAVGRVDGKTSFLDLGNESFISFSTRVLQTKATNMNTPCVVVRTTKGYISVLCMSSALKLKNQVKPMSVTRRRYILRTTFWSWRVDLTRIVCLLALLMAHMVWELSLIHIWRCRRAI